MAEVVRACRDGEWAYVPVGMEKFATRLHSDHGPLALELAKSQPLPVSKILGSIKDKGLLVRVGDSNAVIGFGKGEAFNEHLGTCYKQANENAVIKLGGPAYNKEIVMLLQPESGTLVPGRWLTKGNLCAVEPVEPLSERSFILTEDGTHLISIAMEHGFNGQIIPVYRPGALVSWLATLNPSANRFSVTVDGNKFKITQADSETAYTGEFKYSPSSQPDWFAIEREYLQDSLMRSGLAGVVGTYEIRKAKA